MKKYLLLIITTICLVATSSLVSANSVSNGISIQKPTQLAAIYIGGSVYAPYHHHRYYYSDPDNYYYSVPNYEYVPGVTIYGGHGWGHGWGHGHGWGGHYHH